MRTSFLQWRRLVAGVAAVAGLGLVGCSRGGEPSDRANDPDAAVLDLAGASDGATGGAGDGAADRDLAAMPDLAVDCVRSFGCDARTADHGCGVTTATGQRYPDRGAPYCTDKLSRDACSCELVRCASPKPLCPGTYRAIFNERLIAGCSGIPGELSGTCSSLWNVVEDAGGKRLVDKAMLNVSLSFGAADYSETFTVDKPTLVRAVVQQSCWFSDVSGSGNSGRAEVSALSITQ